MSDIRKWFMRQHDVGNGNTSTPVKPGAAQESHPTRISPTSSERTERRKTSKYFSDLKCDPKDEKQTLSAPAKRKTDTELKPPPKKLLKRDEQNENTTTPKKNADVDADDDYHQSSAKRISHRPHQGKSFPRQSLDDADDDYHESPVKSSGRGRGKRGQGEDIPAVSSSSGRGRGAAAGRAVGFMNFGERKDPPHKGEKEVPEGNPECLAGQTFVISGTLDSLEREEAEDLIKRHGGRVTTAVSKKTNYLLCDEDIGGKKSAKAKELGTSFLTEDRLFEMIRSSKPLKTPKPANEVATAPPKTKSVPHKTKPDYDPVPKKSRSVDSSTAVKDESKSGLPWTEKYRPKTHDDLIGNQSIVKQLHDWLSHWNETFLLPRSKMKGKKPNPAGSAGVAKKAVMLSGTPGIGKTSSAKLVCRMLGFQAVEVNASDSRGKADAKIEKGIGGKSANSIKELICNESLSLSHTAKRDVKSVLIMDEVDGMSAGDRGGVVDLIASIKISKIPIICICNDRYSQKLKSLVNYCLPLNFRKPTKQQMAKRLMQVASLERVHVNQIALEELSERVNGDMRMALNQLQYMHISMSTVVYDDVRHRLMNSAKDEDISPFAAVDKLFGFNGGNLRMDERIDLGMSDPDLVPLLVQENYLNYRPTEIRGGDEGGVRRMERMSRAAESIGDGDIMNVQIRRYRQWQLSQCASVVSSIFPAALMRGSREVLEPGERNFNRFAGWLGKNSTAGKNARLLADVHAHAISSRVAVTCGKGPLRLDVLTVLVRRLTDPLRTLPKDDALCEVIGLMDAYSMSQDDFDAAIEMSRFQRWPGPLDGVLPAVKSSLMRAYNQGMKTRALRAADLVPLPGSMKKKGARKSTGGEEEMMTEGGEDVDSDDAGDDDDDDDDGVVGAEEKLELHLQSLKSKGMVMELEADTVKGNNRKRKGGASTEKRSTPASATRRKR